MKRVVKILGIILMVSVALNMNAQTTREEQKEIKAQKKQQNEVQRSLYKKSPKKARKWAKKMTKKGYTTLGLPLDKQRHNAWMKEEEMDASGYPRYIVAEEKVTAQTFVAGQMMAENAAKQRIAGAIKTHIVSLATLDLANGQLTEIEAGSVTKATEKVYLMVCQQLGRLIKVLEMYRPIKSNNNVEVVRIVAYDMKTAMTMAQESMIEELKRELKKSDEELKKLRCLDGNNLCSMPNLLGGFDEIAGE